MIDKLKSRWDYKDPPREVSVEDAIECSVVGSRDYGEGELERLRNDIDHMSGFLASLTAKLYRSGKLTDEELLSLLGSYVQYD